MTLEYPPFVSRTLIALAMQGQRSVRMEADAYLYDALRGQAVDTSEQSPVRGVLKTLHPVLRRWAGEHFFVMHPSGSFAKGTANRIGTDIDIFISLKSTLQSSLKDIYGSLFTRMEGEGYTPKQQNVSINIRVGGYDVDLVPGRRQDFTTADHSLFRRRADTWTKTNVQKHIALVRNANRANEIRIIKLWREYHGLDFPSFYLELTVINALFGSPAGRLSANVVRVLEYLRDTFPNARVMDPANTGNVISDDLTASEKATIKNAATRALAGSWSEMIE